MVNKSQFDQHFNALAECRQWKLSPNTLALIGNECRKLEPDQFEELCRMFATAEGHFTPADFLSEVKTLRRALASTARHLKALPSGKPEENLCTEALQFCKFMRLRKEYLRKGRKGELDELCVQVFSEPLTDEDLNMLSGANPQQEITSAFGHAQLDPKEDDVVWVSR